MSGARGFLGSVGASLARVASVHRRVWYRLIAPLAVLFLLYVVGLAILAVAMRPFLESQAEAAQTSAGDATLLTISVLVPMVALLAMFGLVWAGAAVFVADGAAAGRATSPWRSATQTVRRLPAAFLVVVLWLLAVFVSFVLAPIAVIAGVLGLLLTPILRRTDRKWPTARTLVALAVPFGFMFVVASRLGLAPAALFLDGVGVRAAFAQSWNAVRGRTGRVGVVLLTTLVVIVAFSLGVRALVDLVLDGDAELIVSQLSAHVLVAPLLLVAIAVLYRAGGAPVAPNAAVAPVRGSHRAPIGLTLVMSLIVSLGTVLQTAIPAGATTASQEATSPTEDTTTTSTTVAPTPTTLAPPTTATGVPRALVGTTVPQILHSPDLDVPLTPGVPVNFTASAAFNDPGCSCEPLQPSGAVNVLIDNVLHDTAIQPSGQLGFGSISNPFSATFTAGIHVVTISYVGDATFAAASANVIVAVGDPSTTTLTTFPVVPSVYGQAVTFAATVTGGGPTPTGAVRFTGAVGLTQTFVQDAPLVGGVATLTTSTIPAGTHNVVAHYLGDAVYIGSESTPPVPVSVAAAPTDTRVSVTPTTVTPPNQPVTANVEVVAEPPSTSTPRGRVNISVNGAVLGTGTLNNGRASISFIPPAGLNIVTASYVPADGSWVPSAGVSHHEVTPALVLSVGRNPTLVGDPIDLLAVVSAPKASGDVIFVARRISRPPTGTASATVSHSEVLDGPVTAGAPTTFTVQVAGLTGLPTGLVTVTVDDGEIPVTPPTRFISDATDAATLDFTAEFPPGAHTVTISYQGDQTFAAQVQTVEVEAVELPDNIDIEESPAPDVPEDEGPPLGETIILGVAPLGAFGIAGLSSDVLPAGLYELRASLSGNATLGPLQAEPVAHVVRRATTTMALSTDATDVAVGDEVTVDVEVTPSSPDISVFRESVTLTDGTNTLGSGLLTGPNGGTYSTSITFHAPASGARTVTGAYGGNEDADGATATLALDVARQSTGVRIFGDLSRAADYGEALTFDGVVTTTGTDTPTGEVRLVSGTGVLGTDTVGADGRFSFEQVLPAGRHRVWVEYLGDGSFLPSSILDLLPARDDRVTVEVAKATSVPEVAFAPRTPVVGEDVTITAALAARGAGPTGTVEFFDVNVSPRQLLGSAPVLDGVATIAYAPTSARTLVLAAYSGDRSFDASENPSPYALLEASPATARLAVRGPSSPVGYGTTTILTVTATSSVTGRPAAGAVTVREGANRAPLARDVPLVNGEVSIGLCAGDEAVCGDAAAIGLGEHELTIEYVSATGGAAPPITTTVEVVPTPTAVALDAQGVVLQGSDVPLEVVVTFDGNQRVSSGAVAFYALEPRADGTSARHFLTRADLVDGAATGHVTVGTELEWPADGIEAEYVPSEPRAFSRSTTRQPIVIERIGTSIEVTAPEAPVGAPTTLSALLRRDAGASQREPTGSITITADEGTSCTTELDGTTREATCEVTWTTTGDHSFRAEYSGDSIFLPSQSEPLAVVGTRGTPSLRPRISSPTIVGAPTEVRWTPPANGTGTVTVLADVGTWCTVDVAVGVCSNTFTNSAARERFSPVRVRYSGDDTWNPVEETVTAFVQGCYAIEVSTYQPGRGSVSVDTPSNCGNGRYLAGTEVRVSATVVEPNEFRGWLRLEDRAPDGWAPARNGPHDLSTSFVVGDEPNSWVLRAEFALPCVRIDANVTGAGHLDASSEPDCTLADDAPGYSFGTELTLLPVPEIDPDYDEPSDFYGFDPVPAGAEIDENGALHLTATTDEAFDAPFGPHCRLVTVTFDPEDPEDESEVVTEPNCESPLGDGFFENTMVQVRAASGDDDLVLEGWDVNGEPDPDLGKTPEIELKIGETDVELTAHFGVCFELTALAPEGLADDKPLGEVTIDPEPNCGDESGRYEEGTEVTLEPVVLKDGATFSGWQDEDAFIEAGNAALGEDGTRTIVVDRDIATYAEFYLAAACSILGINAPEGLGVRFETLSDKGLPSGCGPGYYYDRAKVYCSTHDCRGGSREDIRIFGSDLQLHLDPANQLPVHASVGGAANAPPCFPMDCTGPVTGDLFIRFDACQGLKQNISIVRLDQINDPNAAVYSPYDFSAGMGDYDWIVGEPESDCGTSTKRGNGWLPDSLILLRSSPPAVGFQFLGWGVVDNLVGTFEDETTFSTPATADAPTRYYESSGVAVVTSKDKPALHADAFYGVVCGTLTLGEGVSVVGPPPNCPGGPPGAASYVIGTFVQVSALQSVDGERVFAGYSSGVIAGSVTEDRQAMALIDNTKGTVVKASYPTNGELFVNGLATAGKFTLGVFAVAAPIFATIMCGPCGIALAALTMTTLLLDLIPGVDGKASAALQTTLLAPFTVADCTARWGFGSTELPPSYGSPTPEELGVTGGKLGKSALEVAKAVSINRANGLALEAGLEAVGLKSLVKIPSNLKLATSAAAFGYGLYDAGIGKTDFSYQTVNELRDTAGFSACMTAPYEKLVS